MTADALLEEARDILDLDSTVGAVAVVDEFGDIYIQILAWMGVIFVSLAAGLALMGSSRPIFALLGVGLILYTILNHVHHNY